MKKSCKNCIYREDDCLKENEVCGDHVFGDPEDRAGHETDISGFTVEENFEDFCDYKNFE